jgi:hypothetical protein
LLLSFFRANNVSDDEFEEQGVSKERDMAQKVASPFTGTFVDV